MTLRSPRFALLAALLAVGVGALPATAGAVRPVGKVRALAPERSYEPVIAHRAKRDEYLVTYAQADLDAGGVSLFSQRVSRGGGAVGQPVRIALLNPQTPPQGEALVHNPRRDEYLLVWRIATGPNNAPHEIVGQRLDAAGRPLGETVPLVRTEEPGLRPVTQCCMPPALAYDGRGGYFVAWGSGAGFFDQAVAGRPVSGTLGRGAARKLTTRDGSTTAYSIAADPSGYLLASWVAGPANAQGVYTDLVSRAGTRRRGTYRVHSPGGEVALARNSRTGRFALAWQEDRSIMDSQEPLRVQQLDATGRSLGPRSVVAPYKEFRRTTLEGLTYSHAANEYLLGWIGTDERDPTQAPARSSLRSLTGAGAKPFGPTVLPSGLFGPFMGASTRAARWLVINSSQSGLIGQIYAPSKR